MKNNELPICWSDDDIKTLVFTDLCIGHVLVDKASNQLILITDESSIKINKYALESDSREFAKPSRVRSSYADLRNTCKTVNEFHALNLATVIYRYLPTDPVAKPKEQPISRYVKLTNESPKDSIHCYIFALIDKNDIVRTAWHYDVKHATVYNTNFTKLRLSPDNYEELEHVNEVSKAFAELLQATTNVNNLLDKGTITEETIDIADLNRNATYAINNLIISTQIPQEYV